MKKQLGIILLIFAIAVGFSGAVAAVNGDNFRQGTTFKKNNFDKKNNFGKRNNFDKRWVVVWSGSWNSWKHSWWWRHGFRGNHFWFKKHQFRKIVRFNKFGKRTVIIIRR